MRHLPRAALLASTALTASLLCGEARAQLPPETVPQGGQVVGGAASIRQAPGSTTITQGTERAAIDWRRFDVGAKARVIFHQPNADAVTLNRVTSPDASRIEGRIDANGQVVLINQSGVVFGKGAQVNAQSLVVSAANLRTRDFMAGRLDFDQAPRPGARIVNRGTITVKQAGLAAFVAPQVANRGTIIARLGHVVLAGAETFTLDLYGDRLISLDVTGAVRTVDVRGRKVAALVTNSGLILADGGSIRLEAREADALIQTVLDVGGTLRADTVGRSKGSVTITGIGGDIQIAGALLARGTQSGIEGGKIGIDGTGAVRVEGGARLDASGAAGGGRIAIGVKRPPSRLVIARGARITADAKVHGDGGRIILRSHAETVQDGALSARGADGEGGVIETSSDGVISLSGTETVLSLGGHPGTILLDPATLVIGPGTPSAAVTRTTTIGNDAADTSYVDPRFLDALGGTVVLEATQSISVAAAVANPLARAISLVSGGAVSIGAPVSIVGSLEIDAAATIGIGALIQAGMVTLNDSAPSGGGIAETAGGAIDAMSLRGTLASGSAVLEGGGNSIAGLGGFSVSQGGFSLNDTAPLSVSGVTASGAIGLSDTSQIRLSGPIDAGTAGTVSLVADTLAANREASVSAPGGTIALAPDTTGAPFDPSAVVPVLGTAASQLSIGSVADHEAGALTISRAISGFSSLALAGTGTMTIEAALSAPGSIALTGGGIALDAPVTAGVLDLTSGSGVSQTGPVTAGVLEGSVSAGAVILTNTTNAITGLGGLTVANAALDLVTTGPLTISGRAAAQAVTLSAGAIGIDGPLSSVGALMLSSPGAITETGAGMVTAGTLTGIGGEVTLGNLANAIGTLGDFTAADLVLGDGIGLTVTGLVSAGSIALADAQGIGEAGTGAVSASTLSGSGPLGDVVLTGGRNAIGTLGGLSLAGGSLSLTDGIPLDIAETVSAASVALADSGGITETGAIEAARLSGSVTGGVALPGPGNRVDSLGPFTVSNGDFSLDDAVPLAVGTVTASNVALDADGLTLDGPVTAGTLIGLGSTNGITETGAGLLSAPTLVGLGQVSGGVDLSEGANTVGTLGDFTIASGSLSLTDEILLDIAGTVSAASVALVDSGGITETGAIEAGRLSGAVTGGTVLLTGPGNQVGSLGPFTVSNGDFSLDDAVALIVGTVTASNVALDADGLTLDGPVTAGTLIGLGSTNGITETGAGLLSAPSLAGIGQVSGGVDLSMGANSIGTLGDFGITGGGFALADTAPLDLAGGVSLSAGETAALSAAGFSASGGVIEAPSGSIGLEPSTAGEALAIGGAAAPGTVAVASSFLAAIGTDAAQLAIGGTGGLAVDAPETISLPRVILSGAGIAIASTLAVPASLILDSTGGVSEAGMLSAGTLAGNVTGDIALPSSLNGIGTISALSATGGVTIAGAAPLTLAGALAAGNASSIALAADVIAEAPGGALDAPGGSVAIAPLSPGLPVSLGGTASGRLAISQALLSAVSPNTGTLIIGAASGHAGGALSVDGSVSVAIPQLTLSGTSIAFANTLNAASLVLTGGTVTQSLGTIGAATLSGDGLIGGPVSLTGANSIGVLGALDATGDIAISDAVPLTIVGPVTAPDVALDGAGLTLAGGIDASGGITLSSTAGILQTAGVLTAGTISGAATNAVSLNDANDAGTLGGFTVTAGGFTVTDADALTVAGPVQAPEVSLEAPGLDITGLLGAGGAMALGSSTSITATGTIDAATLTSIDTIGGAVSMTGSNSIGTLGAFSAQGDFALNDISTLDLAGTLQAPSVSLTARELNFTADLTTGDLTLAGGGATQTGGTISAALLSSFGDITGPVGLMSSGNTIGTLGAFTVSDGLTLVGTSALTVSGPVSAQDVSLDAAGITLTGPVSAANAVTLTSSGDLVESGGAITAATLASGGTITGAASLTGGNSIASLGDFASTEPLDLIDDQFLTIAGRVVAPTIVLQAAGLAISGALVAPQALTLGSSGGVTESGMIDTAVLTSDGTIQGAVDLGASNNIATLGNFGVTGGLVLNDTGALGINGQVEVPGTLLLDATQGVTQSGGLIDAGTLGGSAAGGASFPGPDRVTVLGDFTVLNGVFSLTDKVKLTVAGPVTANAVSLVSFGQMILDGVPGGGLFIGGSYAGVAPDGPRQGIDSLLQVKGGGTQTLTQTGAFEINAGAAPSPAAGFIGHPSTLFVLLTPQGRPDFADQPSPFAGLNAPATEMFLNLGGGTASGRLNLLYLTVIGGEPGEVNFTGTLNNVAGQEAAHFGAVVPLPQSNFDFNGCPIGSVTCVVIPIEAVPEGDPLRNFDISRKRRRRLDRDVHLPGVAKQDF